MKNLHLNAKKIISMKGTALILAASTSLGALTGCGTVDCDVKDTHSHLYINDDGYLFFIPSEKKTYHGFERNDHYIIVSEDEKN